MRNMDLYAYIILSEDEYMHQYNAQYAWLTGNSHFIGSIVITLDQVALWTDDRYEAQVRSEFVCDNWLLMRHDGTKMPVVLTEWIASKLDVRSSYNKVGMSAQYTSFHSWSSMKDELILRSVPLVAVAELFDRTDPDNPVYVHNITFAGISWEKKVETIARLINAQSAQGLVVTELDEIAWLFNVRGSDILYRPFFRARAFVHVNQTTHLWMNTSQLTLDARIQLANVDIQSYNTFLSTLDTLVNDSAISKIWVTQSAAQEIVERIPASKRFISGSPIERTKAVKNPTEQKGMRESSIRDSVARVKHLNWLQNEIKNDRPVNETQAAEKLEYFQSQQAYFKGISFETISAVGANAAVIHFQPKPPTAVQITKDKVYLLDAGAQYLDGTTDVTRTHTFGTP
ncbi:unnamed protein product, partial [Adineta ricciae]